MRYIYVEINDVMGSPPESKRDDDIGSSRFGTTFEHFTITFKYIFKKPFDAADFFFSNLTNSNLKIFSYKKTVFPLSLKVIRPEVLTLWNRAGFELAPTYSLPFVYLPKGEIFQQNRAFLKSYITTTHNYLNYSWLNQGGWTYIPFVDVENYENFLYRTGMPEGWRYFITEYGFIIRAFGFYLVILAVYEFYRILSGEICFIPLMNQLILIMIFKLI